MTLKLREQAGQPRIAVSLVGEIFDGALQRTQARAAAVLHLQLEAAGACPGLRPAARRTRRRAPR